MSNINKFENGELIENQVQKITEFLDILGLPSDNIIADNSQREIIGSNLPSYIAKLPAEIKHDARYLSKFIVGAGFGLFDYALNSVWNEVVLSLRTKAITYGIEIFFDKAVGGTNRTAYINENDLPGLKDSVLLNTCKKLELISETTFKKLAHILDMRNDIGISHPTNYTINAFELLGWLQTSVEDVISDKPSEAAIQVKAFIDNLKTRVDIIDQTTVELIKPQIKSLATHHCDSILRTIFGLYVMPDSEQILRKNITLFAPTIWNCCSDEEKYRLGMMIEGYNNNLHQLKYQKGEEFFTNVQGNNFRTKSERTIGLNNLADRLNDAHMGWDNFYHEVPVIEKIMTYIDKSSDIPHEISNKLIRYILKCRIGKRVNYNRGVAPNAEAYYDNFFNLIGEEHFPQLIIALTNYDIQNRMSNEIARENAIFILQNIRKNLISPKYIETIDYLLKNLPGTEKCVQNTDFKKITSIFLKWN